MCVDVAFRQEYLQVTCPTFLKAYAWGSVLHCGFVLWIDLWLLCGLLFNIAPNRELSVT